MPFSDHRLARWDRKPSWDRHRPAADRERRRECEVLCVAALSGSFAPIMPNLRTKFPIVPGNVECEQGLAILRQALGGLAVFQLVGCGEGVERGLATLLVSAIQISCNDRLAFGCWLFGSLLRTLAVLCTQQRCSRCSRHRRRQPPARSR